MAITPTYSWPLPDDTDLVKDGAEAIRDLGNAIDTTVGGLSSGGLVHINTSTYSGVASHSVNDVFSSTFDDYEINIVISAVTTMTDNFLNMRFRIAGTDTSTNYGRYVINQAGSGLNILETHLASPDAQMVISQGIGTTHPDSFVSMRIFSPNLARRTFTETNSLSYNNSNAYRTYRNNSIQASTTQFDGFTLIPATGTITGKVSVYGYAKA